VVRSSPPVLPSSNVFVSDLAPRAASRHSRAQDRTTLVIGKGNVNVRWRDIKIRTNVAGKEISACQRVRILVSLLASVGTFLVRFPNRSGAGPPQAFARFRPSFDNKRRQFQAPRPAGAAFQTNPIFRQAKLNPPDQKQEGEKRVLEPRATMPIPTAFQLVSNTSLSLT
jgi:hypothetical protein